MRKTHTFLLLILIVSLAGCTWFAQPTPSPTPKPTATTPPRQANADVVFVRVEEQADGSWSFEVTVEHPDLGWEDYADGWDVVLPDGTVLKPDPEAAYTRVLTHPHEDEQPVTRSQSGIVIPEGTLSVTVRAHDLVDGFGGKEVEVLLNDPHGLNYEVIRAGSEGLLPSLGVTNQRPDGNRLVPGQIDLANTAPIDIPLKGVPVWVVGVPDETGNPVWVVALEDGQIQGFRVENGAADPIELPVLSLSPGTPPAISYEDDKVVLLNLQAPSAAPLTHPILTPSGNLAYINAKGEVVVQRANGSTAVEKVDALTDGRLLSDGAGQILALTVPTDTYQHGILGDEIEAKAATLLTENGQVIDRLAIFSDQVAEGLAPIWVDLDGDGERDLILTLSNRSGGAQLVVMDQSGQIIAQSDPIGTGYRWRHQIAVAPVGPEREIELVDVLTPHIGGVVEFFRLEGSKLVKVAEISGYTSHVIYTRNLDMAFVADLDADGRLELIVPKQDLSALGILQRTADGVEVVTDIPLESKLTSNLGTVSLPDGGLAVAAGTESGLLRVWVP